MIQNKKEKFQTSKRMSMKMFYNEKIKKSKKVIVGKLNNIEINFLKNLKTLGYRSRAAFKLN